MAFELGLDITTFIVTYLFLFFLFNNLYTAVSKYMCSLASIYQLSQKKNKQMSDWLGSFHLTLDLNGLW